MSILTTLVNDKTHKSPQQMSEIIKKSCAENFGTSTEKTLEFANCIREQKKIAGLDPDVMLEYDEEMEKKFADLPDRGGRRRRRRKSRKQSKKRGGRKSKKSKKSRKSKKSSKRRRH
jgi:predicted helicase